MVSLCFLPTRNSSRPKKLLCITAQSKLVSSNRFMRRSECFVNDTTTVVYSDERGLFFLSKALFNLASRKCSQYAAGSRTKSSSVSIIIIALLLTAIFPPDGVVYIEWRIFSICSIGIPVRIPTYILAYDH